MLINSFNLFQIIKTIWKHLYCLVLVYCLINLAISTCLFLDKFNAYYLIRSTKIATKSLKLMLFTFFNYFFFTLICTTVVYILLQLRFCIKRSEIQQIYHSSRMIKRELRHSCLTILKEPKEERNSSQIDNMSNNLFTSPYLFHTKKTNLYQHPINCIFIYQTIDIFHCLSTKHK